MDLPEQLERVVEDFSSVPPELRVEVLLDYASKVPPLPERYRDAPDAMEPVSECQTPFSLAVEVDDAEHVSLYFDCPPSAPTQRSFAGLLLEGLNGATIDEVLAVPQDFSARLGLAEVISAQRLQGLHAILGRLQRQVELARAA